MNNKNRRQKTEDRKQKNIFKLSYKFIYTVFLLSAIFYNIFFNNIYADEKKQVTAETVFDKAVITIGEKVKYSVTVSAPKDTRFDFSVIDNALTETGFAIRDFGQEKPINISKDKIKVKQWYLLDTYVTGSYNVPSITINYTLSDGTTGSTQTKDIFLEVKSVIKEGEKAEDIKDIKAPVEIKVNYKLIILWSILVLFLIILMAIIILLYIKYKHKIFPVPPPLPPYIIALRELEIMKKMVLSTEEQIKKYYIGISGIVRHYIENIFSLRAPERTTEEFLQELTQTETLNSTHKILLRNFLKHCDMVKFAKYGPTKEEIEGVYNTAKSFVEETKPHITEQEENQK